MNYFMKQLVFILVIVLTACVNSQKDIRSFEEIDIVETEVTRDIELLYSDSSQVKVRLTSPLLLKSAEPTGIKEVFPDGIHVEFFSNSGKVNSYMDAKMAEKNERQGIIIASDSVVVYNRQGDKLETNRLIWNENKRTLENNRFVRITRPSKRDTLYGFGISADQDFARFEIKEVLGKSMFEKLTHSLN